MKGAHNMKRILPLILTTLLVAAAPPARTPTGIPLFKGKSPTAPAKKYVYRDESATVAPLVSVEQVKKIVESFRMAYAKMGQPRLDIRVNQPFGTVPMVSAPPPGSASAPDIDPATGLPLNPGVAPVPPVITPASAPGPAPLSAPTRVFDSNALSDQQTKRDVQRLFGRPLRSAGVKLHDMDLVNLPEVSLEVLISERTVTLRGIGGEQELKVPDLQVTAIRLSDGRILGQATVLDLFPRPEQSAHQLRRRSIHQLAEATALMLMRDMAATAD